MGYGTATLYANNWAAGIAGFRRVSLLVLIWLGVQSGKGVLITSATANAQQNRMDGERLASINAQKQIELLADQCAPSQMNECSRHTLAGLVRPDQGAGTRPIILGLAIHT